MRLFYIPWTDELLLHCNCEGVSYLMTDNSCERGSLTVNQMWDWGWIEIGDL